MNFTKAIIVGAIFLVGVTAWTQEWPKVEVGADYSYLRFAPSGPLAVTTRATWLRPGTITVTLGIWPALPPAAFGAALFDAPLPITMRRISAITTTPITAAITSWRRRRERSTTTSVSEEWIEVSLFIMSMPIARILSGLEVSVTSVLQK